METAILILAIASVVFSFVAMVACILVVISAKKKNNIEVDIAPIKDVIDLKVEKIEATNKLYTNSIDEKISKLVAEMKSLNEQNTKNYISMMETLNSTLSKMGKETREENQKAIENLNKRFDEFSKSMQEKYEQVDKTVGKELSELRRENSERLESMQKAVGEKLDGVQKTVDEKLQKTIDDRLKESFENVVSQIGNVNKAIGEIKGIATDVGSLKNVLTNVKTRGTWGEMQLDNMLSEMLSREQYLKNVSVDGKTQERVDFAIILPGKTDKVLLPIDSKFPIEAYERIIKASDLADAQKMEEELKSLESAIKSEAKSISNKYVKVPFTTDFALMYLPLEGLYAEVLRRQGLVDYLQKTYRVIVCGPNTLGALLTSLQVGFKTVAIEQKSSEIMKLLIVFKTEFKKFNELLEKTKKKIDEASDTIEQATRKTKSIAKRLDNVETKGLISGEEYNEI